MLRFLSAAAAIIAVAGAATAAPVAFTNSPLTAGWAFTSSGQVNDYFSGVRDSDFDNLELGLRVQERFSATPVPFSIVNSLWGTLPMYTVQTGPSAPPAAEPDYAWWNFDFSVRADSSLSQYLISLDVTPVAGSVQDLNDIFVGFTPLPNPWQVSWNPGFNFLSGASYDFNQTGIYLITLSTANTDDPNNVRSTQILVNVGGVAVPEPVPEPVSLVVFGSLIAGATVAVWRRQAKRA